MQHTLVRLLILLLATAAAPLAAELVVCDMTRVRTQSSHPDDCLAAVVINSIDGEKRALSPQGFLIEPGVHTINGRVTLDSTKCPSADGYKQLSNTPALAVNFEAGKTYFIAYDHGSDKSHEWTLVVWKMEQSCSAFQTCLPVIKMPATQTQNPIQ